MPAGRQPREPASRASPPAARARQPREQRRDGGGLVRLLRASLLAEHQALVGGERRNQMQSLTPGFAVIAAPGGLASRAIRSGTSGHHSRTQLRKQAENRSGSMRFMSVRSQSAQGSPKWNALKRRRNERWASPQSTMSS